MGIGAVSGLSTGINLDNYRINSIYGNPKNLRPIGKIGKDDYSGNPFAIVSRVDDEKETERIKMQQNSPFDFTGAMERAKNGLNVSASAGNSVNLKDEMTRMMIGSRFSAESIPLGDVI